MCQLFDILLWLACRTPVTANYVRLTVEPGKGVYEYEVRFEPELDSRGMQNKLLNQHSKELGETKTFDGTTLYLPVQLQQEVRVSSPPQSVENACMLPVSLFLMCWI
jgi:aubergine-like protein